MNDVVQSLHKACEALPQPGTQGLPNVNPVYTWVRLAQRVPVRIRITHVPASVPLVSGMTVTVTIRGAEARESGAYRDPIIGQVQTVTRGISVANAAPSTQGLPNVNPVYTWVRLAQRVPVRIRITHVPAGVPLVSGMTVTVTIRGAEARESGAWLRQRFASLVERLNNVVHGPQPSAGCVPLIGNESGATVTLPTPQPSAPLTPEDINPGLAPGLANSPRIPRIP